MTPKRVENIQPAAGTSLGDGRRSPLRKSPMVVEVSEGIAAIEKLAPEWESLIAPSAAAIFSHPAWYLAWAEAFRPEDVAVVTAREGNRLVGVLPLARVRTDARGLYFRPVAPFALGDYQPFIVAPTAASTVLPAILDTAVRRYGHRGVYWWPHVPGHDPSLEILKSWFDRNRMPFVEEEEIAPRLHIGGADYATVEKGWTANLRSDIRRKRKKLSEVGPVSLWQPQTADEAETLLHEFFEVHDAKWLSEGYPGRFQNPAERAHFRALLRRFWGRGIHFSTVRCGETNVSYHFGFVSGKWLLWYRPTYRPEFGRFSPSKIHISLLVEEACRHGWDGFDFLLGEEPYKYSWTNGDNRVVNIQSGFSKWAPSYFWFSRGKPFVRRKLQGAYMRWQARRQKRTS